ncbi:glutathione S-transferase family protein [Telmatospirillum sp.]|uniref:glutathione S-transferase family protein n=1 Tax=Telmatospirillum sp. TaxID=2079197 RepID=UPI00284B2490|nr:glutathione S-transferase family protein [Telmatospirillum sp.]MDR3440428.1 glutathione S-transferase family protein [Telmatospirillum sp.]
MITLFTFGPAFGLPDPSPFVTKADLLLKMSGLAYRVQRGSLSKAPKGKLPYIQDGDAVIADSTFIRLHLEERYGVEFDVGLSPAERAVAWSVEKMCEDHLYWMLVAERWTVGSNFKAGPAQFFKTVPAIVRPLIELVIRRKLGRTLAGQGTGRHSPAERARLCHRAFAAIGAIIGTRSFLMGEEPCGADATVYAFVSGFLCPLFEGPAHDAAAARSDLVAYCARMAARFYPEPELPAPAPGGSRA